MSNSIRCTLKYTGRGVGVLGSDERLRLLAILVECKLPIAVGKFEVREKA